MHEKAKAMILGLSVGDALGGPVEFMTGEKVTAKHGLVTEMLGGGWLDLEKGQTTDDTAMAMCLLASLSDKQAYDSKDVLTRYIAWMQTDPPDIGSTISAALRLISGGMAPAAASKMYHRLSDGQTASNGSLMRIAPLAMIENTEQRIKAVRTDSKLTHYDERATIACVHYTNWLAAYLQDQEPDFQTEPELKALLEADWPELHQRANQQIGYVYNALSLAYWAAHQDQDPSKTLSEVVSCGGDADTNGAIVGALLGAKYGDVFPDKWTKFIQEKSLQEKLVDAFYELKDH